MVGNWKVNVSYAMPQKVATAMAKLKEIGKSEFGKVLVGADYEPIAYLGYQEVNGINHAVLAEQTILTGRDTTNVVVLVFNEKPGEMDLTLVGIDRIVESGGALGGTTVKVEKEIPDGVKAIWDEAFEGYVGGDFRPFALLGTQLANGVNYIFGMELVDITPAEANEVVLVTINETTRRVTFGDMLRDKHQSSLGYAFSW